MINNIYVFVLAAVGDNEGTWGQRLASKRGSCLRPSLNAHAALSAIAGSGGNSENCNTLHLLGAALNAIIRLFSPQLHHPSPPSPAPLSNPSFASRQGVIIHFLLKKRRQVLHPGGVVHVNKNDSRWREPFSNFKTFMRHVPME